MFHIILAFLLIFSSVDSWPLPNTRRADLSLEFKIISSNARLDFENQDPGEQRWDVRKSYYISALANQTFDIPVIFGIQELYKNQLDDVLQGLNDLEEGQWEYVGIGLEDGEETGDYNAVIYNTDDWESVNKTNRWLSETPNTPSKSWDTGLVRGVTIVELESKNTGKHINFLNTHLDHIGAISRQYSAELIGKWVEQIPNDHETFAVGDFNSPRWAPPHQELSKYLSDAKIVAKDVKRDEKTYTGFTWTIILDEIDFVWAPSDAGSDNAKTVVESYDLIETMTSEGWRFSDHLPVVVTVIVR